MRVEAAVLIALLALPAWAADSSTHAVSPYVWREDFRDVGLAQFASYPPVQDIGYDPSLSPTTEFEPPNGRALMRVVKPVRAGPERFGFIRALDLATSGAGVVALTYRLESANPEDEIEIGIAGSDGRRYAANVPVNSARGWHAVRISLAKLVDPALHGAPAHTGIAALFVVANLKHANPDLIYRLLIGNLALEAARDLRFEVASPRSVSIAHWPELFSRDVWETGRPLHVEATAPLPLSRAECVIEDQRGRTLGTQVLSGRGRVWSGDAVVSAAAPGVATLLVRGVAANGTTVSTRIRILLRSAQPAAHPRLYFGPADRERLIARTADPRYEPIWRALRERARAARQHRDFSQAPAIFALLDRVHLLPTLPAYFDIVTPASQCVELNALDAYLTGDPGSRDAAIAALLEIARWNAWAPPWFPAHGQHTYYPAGQLAAKTALAYDLLFDRLAPADRTLVRGALREYGIAATYREYVQDNRLLANTSNWLGHTVGGGLVAAAAIWDDGADDDLPLYVNGLLRKFEDHLAAGYLEDGSYGEGISYQEFDLETTGPALTAVERAFGIDLWDRSHVKDSLWYPLSTLAQPVSGSLDTGDSHPPSGHSMAPVVSRSRDPVFAWLYQRFPHSSLLDFLFADFSIPSQPPTAPGSRYFAQKGNVVFRTGWSEDDAVLLFRAGPNFNHNHADQGSFLLRAFGENLVREAGYANYYQDPYYDSFFKQAVGHNTVLVDRDPASQEVADTLRFPALHQYPRITGVLTSRGVDMVASQLEPVYRGRLKTYQRRILMVGSDYIVVSDDLAANRSPAQFEWLLHLPDKASVKSEGDTAWYAGAKAALAVRAVLPAGAAAHVESGHIPSAVFNPSAPAEPPQNPAILEFSTGRPSAAARFLVILVPARTESDARKVVAAARPIDVEGWAGFEIAGDRRDIVMLRKGAARQESSFEGWSCDAAFWMARQAPGGNALLAAESVTTLKHGGRVLFACDKSVSFAAEHEAGAVELTVVAPQAATATVARPDGTLVRLSVPAGQHSFTVR